MTERRLILLSYGFLLDRFNRWNGGAGSFMFDEQLEGIELERLKSWARTWRK